jgi:hypothetical protein
MNCEAASQRGSETDTLATTSAWALMSRRNGSQLGILRDSVAAGALCLESPI